jgi:hypothetical protein
MIQFIILRKSIWPPNAFYLSGWMAGLVCGRLEIRIRPIRYIWRVPLFAKEKGTTNGRMA